MDEAVRAVCHKARLAAPVLARAGADRKNRILEAVAATLRSNTSKILEANRKDLEEAEASGYPKPLLDRLLLNEPRINGICDSVLDLVRLQDPIGGGDRYVRPNGLVIMRTCVPLGVVGIIYEARPNVTVDTAALCLKTGNAIVLRGGKEALRTNRVLVDLMRKALVSQSFDPDLIGFVDATSRESALALMSCREDVDVLIPRGGKGLIRACAENAKIPLLETGAGNCHLYVDASADLKKALSIAINAKCQRPSVCNAIETLLVHESVAAEFLPAFNAGTESFHLEIRGCPRTCAILPSAGPATEEDWDTEYDAYILAVKVVSGLDEAIEHINRYSTHHSEAIVTESLENARRFQQEIDSACVYVNASTRFTDGGEFGFGAEVGISVQKLHARGPMGLQALTTVKYLIEGDGQIRT
ncbi:MAG: glutamate-5-semialdehyde dehydrogenase [Lachnospiraceae bacterium]|nr:glutamate-5-semialdehyde dehydrogenase [Lachnospiraceae bacterium]